MYITTRKVATLGTWLGLSGVLGGCYGLESAADDVSENFEATGFDSAGQEQLSDGGFPTAGATFSGSAGIPGDTDGAGGGTGGGDLPETEDEQTGEFHVPRASGRFVYASSPSTHRLAVIDSETLVVDVVDVGLSPTTVVPYQAPGAAGSVVVLNEGSDDLAMVATAATGLSTVVLRPVVPGANAVVVSPDSRWAAVYHDVDLPSLDVHGSDQDLTMVSLVPGMPDVVMTVGSHPRELQFSPDSQLAFVVSDDGVNVIDMAAVQAGQGGKPALVQVVDDPGTDPSRIEIALAPARAQSIARVDGETGVTTTDLISRQRSTVQLPSVPTDMDLVPDLTRAMLVLPSQTGSHLAELPLPAGDGSGLRVHALGDRYVGQVEIAPDASAMVLHTSVNPWADDPEHDDPRQRVTIARPGAEGWNDLSTLFVEIPVQFVGISPDSTSAIAVHEIDTQGSATAPWSYTLIDLSTTHPVKKLQRTLAEPGSILFVADGSRAALSLRSDRQSVAQIDVVDLASFVVSSHALGAPPTSMGYVQATDRIFVAQDHPTGRISFIDRGGELRTLTGFELNDAIKD